MSPSPLRLGSWLFVLLPGLGPTPPVALALVGAPAQHQQQHQRRQQQQQQRSRRRPSRCRTIVCNDDQKWESSDEEKPSDSWEEQATDWQQPTWEVEAVSTEAAPLEVEPAPREVEAVPAPLEEVSAEALLARVAEARSAEGRLADYLAGTVDELPVFDERLGVAPSHELVRVDEDGDPVVDRDRMVFVDEATCIGCTSCATIATQTFMMEEDHGRARVFSQAGDTEDQIEEAIATCPVDCIHYIPWDELVSLEKEREEVMSSYNFKGRLVGNEGLASTNGAGNSLQDISSNKASRCSNCPSNKCADCPMYSVGDSAAREAAVAGAKTQMGATARRRCGNCPTNGCPGCPMIPQNPEFRKNRVRRERKRAIRIADKKDAIRSANDSGGLGGGVEL